MGFSVKKAIKSGTKAFKGVIKGAENLAKGIADDPLKAAMIAGAAYLTGGIAAGALGSTFAGGVAASTVAAAGAKGMADAKAADIKATKAQKEYNRQVDAANQKASEENRAQLLSLRKQYTKRTSPVVSMGGSGGSSDESTGGFTLG